MALDIPAGFASASPLTGETEVMVSTVGVDLTQSGEGQDGPAYGSALVSRPPDPPGVTEADLCTLGGAQFDGKAHGTFGGSVSIAE